MVAFHLKVSLVLLALSKHYFAITYLFSFLVEGVKLEELILFLVVIVRADHHHDEDGQED